MVRRSYSRGREALRVHVQNTNRPAEKLVLSAPRRAAQSARRSGSRGADSEATFARRRRAGAGGGSVLVIAAAAHGDVVSGFHWRIGSRLTVVGVLVVGVGIICVIVELLVARPVSAPLAGRLARHLLGFPARGETRRTHQIRSVETRVRRVSKGHCALELHCTIAQRVLCERRDATRQS